MAQYMIDIQIPSNPDREFFELIPAQRTHIDRLMEQGIVMSYSLSLDRSRLWVTMNAASEREAVETLAAFPMFRYFEPTIYPMMFHMTSLMSQLKVSLN
ncbi:MAG TPA: muconolactone Delta-isomerase family protein [Bacteroidota bacterium]|nr:muconolactone Delta-isomerase family protein [Bacteroidota bacterium]